MQTSGASPLESLQSEVRRIADYRHKEIVPEAMKVNRENVARSVKCLVGNKHECDLKTTYGVNLAKYVFHKLKSRALNRKIFDSAMGGGRSMYYQRPDMEEELAAEYKAKAIQSLDEL